MTNQIRYKRILRIIKAVNNKIKRHGMNADLFYKTNDVGVLKFDDNNVGGLFTKINLVYGVYDNVMHQSFSSSSDNTYSYRPSPRLWGSVDDFNSLDIELLKLSYIDADNGLYRINDVFFRNDYIVELLVEVVNKNSFDYDSVDVVS